MDLFQGAGQSLYGLDGRWQRNGAQRIALGERIIIDCGGFWGQGNACKAVASLERWGADHGHMLRKNDALQTGTAFKSFVFYDLQRIRQGDFCQFFAAVEGRSANVGNTLFYRDPQQLFTVVKCAGVDALDAAGDGDAGDAAVGKSGILSKSLFLF